jgi:hypothetical protein
VGREKRHRTKQVNVEDLKLPPFRRWVLFHSGTALRWHWVAVPVYWASALWQCLAHVRTVERDIWTTNQKALTNLVRDMSRPKTTIDGKEVKP